LTWLCRCAWSKEASHSHSTNRAESPSAKVCQVSHIVGRRGLHNLTQPSNILSSAVLDTANGTTSSPIDSRDRLRVFGMKRQRLHPRMTEELIPADTGLPSLSRVTLRIQSTDGTNDLQPTSTLAWSSPFSLGLMQTLFIRGTRLAYCYD